MRIRWSLPHPVRWFAIGAFVLLLALPASASARGGRGVSAAVPQAVLNGARVVVAGKVHVRGARNVALEKRSSHGWSVLSRARVRRHGRGKFALSWTAPRRSEVIRIRVVALRSHHVAASSPITKVHITSGHFAPARTTIVGQPGRVSALPAPGQAGTLTLNGVVKVQPGHVLAFGYSANTPDGFLGLVQAVTIVGGKTVIQTQPATLEQAGARGVLDLSTFHEVLPSGAVDPAPLGRSARIAASEGVFNPDIAEGISCSGGVSASLTGRVSVSVTPALHASFSLTSGLTSADFTLTGTAQASIKALLDAKASCSLERTPLLAEPLHIATFTGAVGPIPVVVVLQGQVYVEAAISGQAKACTSVSGSASVKGGVGYSGGGFHPIWSGPNTSFTFKPPTVSADASAGASVKPALQMLLYGVGGPELGVRAGLEFEADTTKDPWWTLTAPFSVDASLVAPSLDLDSGDLTLYEHTFDITDAGGPISDYPIPGC
jgi:hypothetical protein